MNLPINQIIQGDCLEVMKTFPDKSFDLVLTDPPFGLNYDNQEWDRIDFFKLIEDIYSHFTRLLKTGGWMFIYIPKKQLCSLDRLTFDFQIFIETKNFGQFRNNIRWVDCWVPVLVAVNGSPRKDVLGGKNVFMVNSANTSDNMNNPRNLEHSTPKDVFIMQYIISKYTNIGDTILDPFLGSGTTAVAAKLLKRNYIGIEISKDYCEIARQRIDKQTNQLF